MSNPFMLSMGEFYKQTADFWQTAADMNAANPFASMFCAANSDLARAARDQCDQMAGDTALIPDSLHSLFNPDEFEIGVLTPEDRLEARQLGREEKSGLKGMGPSAVMELIRAPS